MVGYGGKDLQKRKVLSLEWKSEGVMDDVEPHSLLPCCRPSQAWLMPACCFPLFTASSFIT